MKKAIFTIIIVLTALNYSFSQTASDYFPSSTGYKWYLKTTQLDSSGNPVPGSSSFRVDSFRVVENYQGLNANVVVTKSGLTNITDPGVYSDTNYFNYQGSDGWKYARVLPGLDTIAFIDTTGILNFLSSLENWYSTFRFASGTGTEYTIFSRDTTIQVDTLTLPLRVKYTGTRLNDETVNTPQGSFLAKKFVLVPTLYYLITVPPFPTIQVKIIDRPDTIWVAQNRWLVKEVMSPSTLDLTQFGVPLEFTIPGELVELTNEPVSIINYSSEIPGDYSLEQNFPNPFNPATSIIYKLPESGFVSLKVFNMVGKEVATIVNGQQQAGSYEAIFDASGLTSGIYFYRLETQKYTRTKKMTLIK